MAQIGGGLTIPEVVRADQVKHLSRPAQVVILKELRAFHEPGTAAFTARDVSRTEAALFQVEAAEFLRGANPVLIKAKRPTADTSNQYVYYMHVAQNVSAEAAAKELTDLSGNVDVASIVVNQSVESTSTAEITLRNPNHKYTYKVHPLRKGSCLFEANDIVLVDLPDAQGRLRRTFTGLVTTVATSDSFDGSINTTITLSCEDETKRLKQNRTNTRPSSNLSEAATALSGFENRFQGKRVHEILEEVLGFAYSKFYTSTAFQSTIHSLRLAFGAALTDNLKGQAVLQQTEAQVSELGRYIDKKLPSNPTFSSTSTGTIFKSGTGAKVVPQYVMGFRLPQGSGLFTASDQAYSAASFGKDLFSGVSTLRRPADLAWVVVGTTQPAYQLTVASEGAVDFYISEWKSNYSLVQEIAKTLFFEFFADPRGVIWFRPLNVALPISSPASPDSLYEGGRPGGVYWIDTDPLDIVQDTATTSDAGLITVLYVRGRYYYGNVGSAPWIIGGAVADKYMNKFGPRQGPRVDVTGLQDPKACSSYAVHLLERINSKVNTQSLGLKGDSRIEPGNFCYLSRKATCSYITNVQHVYRAGSSYNMTLQMTYERSAFAMTTAKAAKTATLLTAAGYPQLAKEMATRTISTVLTELAASGDLDASTRLPATGLTRLGRLQKYTDALDRNTTLQVDGLYFEDLAEFLYESVMDEATSSQLVSAYKSSQTDYQLNLPKNQQQIKSVIAAAGKAGAPAGAATDFAATTAFIKQIQKENAGKTVKRSIR